MFCTLLTACNSGDKKSNEASKMDQQNAINDSANLTTIEWLDSAHQDLGKIKEGQTIDISWRFKNTGDKPLIVSNATASCGCTVAEKPEQPIAPGEESLIKAKFDSHGREGEQRKQVFVTANTKNNINQELSFQVVVEKK
jgi:hypothetical protein